MSLCRNEEMNKPGGSYPRSCPTCKFGPCIRGVKPNGQSAYLKPEHYIHVERYAVVVRKTATVDDGYDGRTETFDVFKEFESEEAFKEYVQANVDRSYNRDVILKYVRFTELQVKTEVVVKVK